MTQEEIEALREMIFAAAEKLQLTKCRVLCVTIAAYLKNLWKAIVIFIIIICLMHMGAFVLTLDH